MPNFPARAFLCLVCRIAHSDWLVVVLAGACVHLLKFARAHVHVGAGSKEDNSVHACPGSACMQTWVFVGVHACGFGDTDDVHATVLFLHTHFVMRTCECVWAGWWMCTRASQHVGACMLVFCNMQQILGSD